MCGPLEHRRERHVPPRGRAGPAAVRAVLVLHGFPELWRHEMAALPAPSSSTSVASAPVPPSTRRLLWTM